MFAPIELHQFITNLLNLRSQVNFISCHKLFENIYIQKIFIRDCTDVLQQKKFSKINKLELDHRYYNVIIPNDIIKNLTHLTASGFYSGITQQEILPLNLVKLDISYNPNITNISHMTNLKVLKVNGNYGISQDSISKLYLIKLYALNNSSIINVSHMSRLETLCAAGICGIDQNGISGLGASLRKLVINDNGKIKNLNHLVGLKKLYMNGRCDCDFGLLKLKTLKANYNRSITDVSELITLRVLHVTSSPNVLDISNLTGLKILECKHNSGIKQETISNSLIKLNATGNKNINNVSHLTNLKILYAANSNINQKGIRGLQLIELDASNNMLINDISQMTSLKILDIRYKSGVTKKNIENLELEKLYTNDNRTNSSEITHIIIVTAVVLLFLGFLYFYDKKKFYIFCILVYIIIFCLIMYTLYTLYVFVS